MSHGSAIGQSRRWLFKLETALDKAVEEEAVLPMMTILSAQSTGAIFDWAITFNRHWMSWFVYASICTHPIRLMSQLIQLSLNGISATLVNAAVITEFGASCMTFFVTTYALLLWATSPQDRPAYVPKRKRGCKPFIRKLRRASRDVSRVLLDVAARAIGAIALIMSLNELATITSAGVPDCEDKKSETNEDETPKGKGRSSTATEHAPVMMWDLPTPRDASQPTTFQLFMRFLHALKAGIRIATDEGSPMVAYSLVMLSLNGTTNGAADDHQYDTDSVLIAIDNCSSRCITNCMCDFVDTPVKVRVSVQDIGGSVTATYKGTVKWTIEDEQGRAHHFLIPDTYFNTATPYRLLSPQHWARVANENHPEQRGTWCATYEDAVELFWKQRQFKRVIKLSASSNIALVRSAPAFTKLHTFCSEVREEMGKLPIDEFELLAMPAATISDEESGDDSSVQSVESRLHPDLPPDAVDQQQRSEEFQENVTHTFRMKKDLHKIEVEPVADDRYLKYRTDQADILAWHYRLGHLSFERIRKLAERGDLPSKLASARAPKCSSCMFGKATRRPWRARTPSNQALPLSADAPGAIVGVDQMILPTPGFIDLEVC
ncbi:unknown protein [Seminavis robusta]|uniref:GAG-pre-integrase domain-containing protein n=1 Tax=Seminavis robusta TaxID=568900 RepID=A0A9N8EFF3_9STRA|nr:unknown protein [Seminavis robusta]|eukprot:Sro1044_g234940.1 n/a (605) ;mRNA; r:33105-35011